MMCVKQMTVTLTSVGKFTFACNVCSRHFEETLVLLLLQDEVARDVLLPCSLLIVNNAVVVNPLRL